MFVEVGSHCRKKGTIPIGTDCSRWPDRVAVTRLGCPERISTHARDRPSGDATG